MEKTHKINYLFLIVTLGLVSAALYHFSLRDIYGLTYPFDTFLFRPHDRYQDFYAAMGFAAGLNPYLEVDAVYTRIMFPFSYLYMYGFAFIGQLLTKKIALKVFLGSFIVFFLWWHRHFLGAKQWFKYLALGILSYPFLFTIDRGNPEAHMFILLAGFVGCFYYKRYWLSALFLSMAIAFKIFPLAFIILYLPIKKYKQMIGAGVFAGLLTIVSLLIFEGSIEANILRMLDNQNKYLAFYSVGDMGILFGNSFFGAIKTFLSLEGRQQIMSYYSLGTLFTFGLTTLYIVFVERQFWRQLFLLVAAVCLLPHVSGDYKLIHLFLPLTFFLAAPPERWDHWYLFLFGILLIPKSYFAISSTMLEANEGVYINPIILLVLSTSIIIQGLKQHPHKRRRRRRRRRTIKQSWQTEKALSP